MKKLLIGFGIISVAAFVTAQLPQQQKEITLRLTQQEVETIYNTIDNAPLSGEIRKPLLQKIVTQYQSQMQPPKQDSIKNKKN